MATPTVLSDLSLTGGLQTSAATVTTLNTSGAIVAGSTVSAVGATALGALTAGATGLGATTASTLSVGALGAVVSHVLSSIKSISFGEVAANDSVVTTVTLAGVVAGAAIIVSPTSKWSGAYNDITINATASAASTVIVSAVNSAATAVTPDAQNFRVTAINFS